METILARSVMVLQPPPSFIHLHQVYTLFQVVAKGGDVADLVEWWVLAVAESDFSVVQWIFIPEYSYGVVQPL